MANRLTKGKRKYLTELVISAAGLVERDRSAKRQARAVMLDYRGRTPHQIIW